MSWVVRDADDIHCRRIYLDHQKSALDFPRAFEKTNHIQIGHGERYKGPPHSMYRALGCYLQVFGHRLLLGCYIFLQIDDKCRE